MKRDWIRKIDLGLLIVSLLIALALWMNVKGERTELRHLYPYIELKNQPADLVIKLIPKTLDVLVQGPPTVLNSIHPDMISVVIDGSSLKPGRRTFPLSIEKNVILQSFLVGRIEVVQILPETLEIVAEPIKSAEDSSK